MRKRKEMGKAQEVLVHSAWPRVLETGAQQGVVTPNLEEWVTSYFREMLTQKTSVLTWLGDGHILEMFWLERWHGIRKPIKWQHQPSGLQAWKGRLPEGAQPGGTQLLSVLFSNYYFQLLDFHRLPSQVLLATLKHFLVYLSWCSFKSISQYLSCLS